MARATKKEQIAAAALPLFLHNGFKGTSIDMVVKTSGVSKPTVYKHFPDKASLMGFVMSWWCDQFTGLSLPDVVQGDGLDALCEALAGGALEADLFRLYRLVVAEGWRFPAAKAAFFEGIEVVCRSSICAWAERHEVPEAKAQAAFSHYLLKGLWATEQ